MTLVERAHDAFAADRRVRVLAGHLAELIGSDGRLLDVGCGDGALTAALGALQPGLECTGIDVHARPDAKVEVVPFDGDRIPFPDDAFDTVLFVDVLHHAESPRALLAEGRRVARRAVVIKDHRLDGPLAGPTLRFMDRVGNARHGVALPYNYWSERQWRRAWAELALEVESFTRDVGLYAWPARLLFDRGLHFVAKLSLA